MMASLPSPTTWILVPAAGSGSRMGTGVPKQYLPLDQRSLLEATLERLLCLPAVRGLVLVLSPDDHQWSRLPLSSDPRIVTVAGGRERADSVLAGLEFLAMEAAADDWVLVHDAARPCVRLDDIARLRLAVEGTAGGILGVPVSDTLKQVVDGRIHSTRDRASLWQAQTPQLFHYALLRDCLRGALAQGLEITDEASAMEAFGHQPLMVAGHRDNLKITHAEDLLLARWILDQQATPSEDTP